MSISLPPKSNDPNAIRSDTENVFPRCLNAPRVPRIIAQMRIKNEERWLKQVLDSIAETADGIVIVDDGSTDSTPDICRAHPAVLDYYWQDEPVQDQVRDKNRHMRMALAYKPDWILSMDGDEILEQSAPERIRDAVRNCPPDVSVLDLEFLYMWNDLQHYRVDGHYKRIFHHRLYKLAGQDVENLSFAPTHFQGNGHCDSVPGNMRGRAMEIDVKVLHIGYMYPEVRRQRYERYRLRDPKEFARGDYEHLLDQPQQVIVEWQERPWKDQKAVHSPAVKQEFKPDYYYANARRNLCELVPMTAKRVLDVGCGHGMTGGLLRSERGIEVVGIDIHEEAAAIARQHLTNVIVGDIETMDLPFEKASFDCILLGDVLEHLLNPWQTLKKLTQYLQPQGTFVVSIPNIRNLGIVQKLLEGSWTYEEWGILDKSHLRFFALKNMHELFADAGIEAKIAEVVRDPQFENEMQSPPNAPSDVNLGNLTLRGVSPKDLDELTAQQFIFTGTLKAQPIRAAIPACRGGLSRESDTSETPTRATLPPEEERASCASAIPACRGGLSRESDTSETSTRATLPPEEERASCASAISDCRGGLSRESDTSETPTRATLPPALPQVSVIIPVFNNLNYTRQCITSLFAVKESANFEVVVVDNGSTDGTSDYLRQLPEAVRTVTLSENHGFAKGCNAGARVARGTSLVFLNNDTVVQPNWLSAMLACAKNDPSIGIVGNLQIFPETGKVQQAGIVCGAEKMVSSIYNNELPADHPAVNKPREFQFIAGSCMLIEKQLFERLGGFDEAYLNSCEDVDLCMKVRAAGRKVFYCPQSRIYHYESRTVTGHDKNGSNYKLFLKRWGDKLVRDDMRYLREDGFVIERKDAMPVRNPESNGDCTMPAASSDPIRVAILTTYNQRCGLSTYAESLVLAMKAQGQNPVILAEKTTDLREPEPANVVRCWTREPNGGSELLSQLRRLGIRVLHVNYGGIFGLDGWLLDLLRAARRLDVRVVVTFHTTESISEKLGELARLADRVLVHHPQNEIELIALGATPGRFEVIPIGMPPLEVHDLFESKIALGCDPARKIVSTFGFVEPHKGVLELIQAMKPVHERTGAELHVLGGPHPANPDSVRYLTACKELTQKLGQEDAVAFSGTYLSDELVERHLRASDVIVLNYTSHRFESSAAAMKALASGRPVISTAEPTFEFAPAVTYKTTDQHHLAMAILDVLTNPFIATALRRNLEDYQKLARQDIVASRILSVYRNVLAEPAQSDVDVMHYYRSHPDDIYAEPLQRERVKWIKSKAEGRILEIGPANGYISQYVSGAEAVDINRGRLAVAQALRPSVHFQFGDVVNGLPFTDREFDTVLAPEILEHVEFEDAVLALRESSRVGKRILVTVPNADKPDYDPSLVHNVEHRWLVNREAVDKLLSLAGCTTYELDTSPENDFYLLDIRTDSDRPCVRIHQRAAALTCQSVVSGPPLHVGIDLGGLDEAHRESAAYAIHSVAETITARPTWTFTIFGNREPSSPELRVLINRVGGLHHREEIARQSLDAVYLCDPLSADACLTIQDLLLSSTFVACPFHDLIPFRFPNEFFKGDGLLKTEYLRKMRLLKERCDMFLCPSQSTAEDLQIHLRIPHDRFRIVHGASLTITNLATSQQALQRLGLDGKRFLLADELSGPHKNMAGNLFALSAVRQVLNEDLRLAIVGNSEPSVRDQVHHLARETSLPESAVIFVPESESHLIRGKAQAYLNPSLWEGSALNLLNAMAAGVPVIAGNNSAQSEACNDAALMVNAEDPEEIARAIISVLQSQGLKRELAEKGMAQARRFTWRRTAEKTAIYLAEAMARRMQTRRDTRTISQPSMV